MHTNRITRRKTPTTVLALTVLSSTQTRRRTCLVAAVSFCPESRGHDGEVSLGGPGARINGRRIKKSVLRRVDLCMSFPSLSAADASASLFNAYEDFKNRLRLNNCDPGRSQTEINHGPQLLFAKLVVCLVVIPLAIQFTHGCFLSSEPRQPCHLDTEARWP